MDTCCDIEWAIRKKIVDSRDDPTRRDDYQKVRSFAQLKGQPSRPIDVRIDPRESDEFAQLQARLGGPDLFDPFNRVLEIVGRPPMKIEPREECIKLWNEDNFVAQIIGDVCDKLDRGTNPLLVPRLVAAFLNLERDRVPSPDEWGTITAISVPGSRTFDRAAEAFRAYLRTDGRASIITSGRAPYYDDSKVIQLTESEANAAYLRLLGVPRERILAESISRDTMENAEFLIDALAIINNANNAEARGLLLVTSPFHLARYRFNIETMLSGTNIEVFALGAKASRYWAETYFLTDAKSGYTREAMIGVVFNEYMKIAFDLCARRKAESKASARRGPQP